MKNKKNVAAAVPFQPVLDAHLKDASTAEVIAYLNACLGDSDDEDMEAFFLALEDIARARGISGLAENARLKRITYYKALEGKNPTLTTFKKILNSLGMDLAVVEKEETV